MSSPQKENGYTPIANEILEQLSVTDIEILHMKIVMFVLRATYGFQKKKDALSIDQIATAVNYSRRSVIYALQDLEAKKMLTVERRTGGGAKLPNLIGFNKNYEEWVVQNIGVQTKKNRNQAKKRMARYRKGGSAKQQVVQNNAKGSAKHTGLVVQYNAKKGDSFAHTKEKRNKERQKKEAGGSQANPDIPIIIDLFKAVNPSYARLFGMPPQRSATERLLKQHGAERLSAMVKYLPQSNADRWAPTITTPVQFEHDLGRLIAWSQKRKQEINKGRGVA